MRVLVVDDNEIFCRLLAEILQDEGMDATWTTDVVAAYDEMSTNGYDLFILDVRMPLILGTELAEAFKATHPRARIILVSAFADESLQKISQSIGVPLLSKPFSARRLIEAVQSALGGSKPQRN
jgi:DNA-binding response OmpR family regulator